MINFGTALFNGCGVYMLELLLLIYRGRFMSVPKLILSDLDHTLLRQDGSISDYSLDVIRRCREKGILFAVATARYWIGAEKYIGLLKPDYEITTDGTLIHSSDRLVYSCEFDTEDTNRIIRDLLSEVPGAEITVASGKTVYWNSRHISESEKLFKAIYNDYSEPVAVRANKIVAELPDEGTARDIASRIDCRLQCYRGEKWYAFVPKHSGKTEAIISLAKYIGINVSEMAAFGDDLNDMEMLSMCGTGIAVANAIPEVIRTADSVTLSNDEDGVAHWLEDNILNKSV